MSIRAPSPRVPPEERIRKKPMKVLFLGLSRTGTMSTYFGLQQLGVHSYHALEFGLNAASDSMTLWNQAVDAKYRGKGKPFRGAKDFDQMLWNHQATTDIPTVLFADELLEAYPDAKIVLTSRDVDSWITSVKASFYYIFSWRFWPLLYLLDRKFTRPWFPMMTAPLHIWSGSIKDPRTTVMTLPDPELLRAGFHEHYTHIRKTVPKERLLEWHPRDGWEPLCKHIGIEVPAELKGKPFVKTNDAEMTGKLVESVYYERLALVRNKVLTWFVGVSAVAGGVAWYTGSLPRPDQLGLRFAKR